MGTSLLEQVFKLLSTDAGNLTYHLVLAFSAAGALQVSLLYSPRADPSRLKRSLFGFILLILFQFVLFAFSGLAWQGLVDSHTWLPALDRAVSLLSLVIVIWLWAFPDPQPSADAAIGLLGLLALAASLFGALWWSGQPAAAGMNGSPPDQLFLGACLALLAFGLFLLAARRPDEWALGFTMLVFLAVGVVLQFALAPVGGSYPAFVRLFQMAAFPFLFILPQRLLLPVSLETAPAADLLPAAAPGAAALYADPALWQALTDLAAESDPARTLNAGAAALARSLQADLCLIVYPPDSAGRLAFPCLYDRPNQRYLEKLSLDSRSLPVLSSAFKMGRPRRLSAAIASPDAQALARALQIERLGNLLFAPVLDPSGAPQLGAILLAPLSGRDWTLDEQAFLHQQLKLLAQFLQRSQQSAGFREEVSQARQMARIAQDQAQQLLDENQKLRDQSAVLQDTARHDRQQIAGLTGLVAAHAAARQSIEHLQQENESLKTALRQASESAGSVKYAEGELRLALQEIALLQQSLAEADQKLTALKFSQVNESAAAGQLQNIVNIAQEVRQPLASIVGYVDVLLGETIGILGAKQRKYLERTKVSTERIDRLLDDLVQAAATESNPANLEITDIDVCKVVQEATVEAGDKLRQKQIALQLDLPDRPLPVAADRLALRRVFVHLLANAGAVTPSGGDVAVRLRLERSESDRDYVLVQVADQGGGIAINDLPRVFTARAARLPIPGLSDNGADLAAVKSLVEVLGGRAWVDSDPGHGATFSVLLPTAGAAHGAASGAADSAAPSRSNGQGAA